MARPKKTVEDWIEDISAAWQKQVSSILETGRLLIRAKAAYPNEFTKKVIEERLPFGDRTAQRLMAIARNKVLSDPTHVSVLPASWGTLAVLADIKARQLLDWIEEGSVHAKMERKDAQTLVDSLKADDTDKVSDAAITGANGAAEEPSAPIGDEPSTAAPVREPNRPDRDDERDTFDPTFLEVTAKNWLEHHKADPDYIANILFEVLGENGAMKVSDGILVLAIAGQERAARRPPVKPDEDGYIPVA